MTVKEFYLKIGADYEETMGRLMKEERIQKYLLKFTESTDYEDFLKAYSDKKYPDAFRFVHNVKGMSLNLGLTPLSKIAAIVCDELRSGVPVGNIEEDSAKLGEVYTNIMSEIKSNFSS